MVANELNRPLLDAGVSGFIHRANQVRRHAEDDLLDGKLFL
jgi:hypothetical protein